MLFSYRGRITRTRFWLGVAVASLFWIGVVYALIEADRPGPEPFGRLCAALTLLLLPLVVLLPVYAKRWHDRDKSGWWSLLVLAPVIGHLWILVELGLMPGTRGHNHFGPDPRV
ncbi:MAG: DUF805 domain-containing protein [Mesorhizobium amorphae]|nr:MAG: DUF805 domain-containing protein [Mesorhizobium amorphae]